MSRVINMLTLRLKVKSQADCGYDLESLLIAVMIKSFGRALPKGTFDQQMVMLF